MKKTNVPEKKKLLLSSEKVRPLTTDELQKAAGGWGGCDGTLASVKTFC